jgi:UDP-2,3-diacylglucosamine pyrophosphatase LpxH
VRTDLNYRVKNVLYRLFQTANRLIKRVRRLLRLPYWSLATTVNRSVAAAASLIANYEEALAGEARCQGMDGVVCGHIHHAALRDVGGVLYCNTGDWVRVSKHSAASTQRSADALRCVGGLVHRAGGAHGRPAGDSALD